MFQTKNNRYITRSVDEEIPFIIQLYLWNLIDEQVSKENKRDYLQIFQLQAIEGGQVIYHRQEIPEWSQKRILRIPAEDCINQRIWVIDSESYQTMLLPEDY